MPKLKNQTALVTGASSGIGAACAIQLSNQGYDVLLLGRDLVRLSKIKSLCSAEVKTETLAFDLKVVSSQIKTIEEKLKALSPLQILVNNAGVFHVGSLLDTSAAVWQEQFEVNLLSAVQLTQFAWPLFREKKSGVVINISSTLGHKPTAQTGAYSAIKAGMINWTLSLAQEGGALGIRANCICPGIVDTPIHGFHHQATEQKAKSVEQMARYQLLDFIGQPQDIASAVCFLAGEESKWTTGTIMHIDGGVNLK